MGKKHKIMLADALTKVYFILSNEEYKKLNRTLLDHSRGVGGVRGALNDFTKSKVCSKHHKYKIMRAFNNESSIGFRYLGDIGK